MFEAKAPEKDEILKKGNHQRPVPPDLKYFDDMCGPLMAFQPLVEGDQACFFSLELSWIIGPLSYCTLERHG